jgi:hypothetical protein
MLFMKKRSLAALAIAVPALIAGTASSAAATTCGSGYSCVWEDPNYVTNGNTLAHIKFYYYIPELGSWNYNGTSVSGHDTASSMHNNGTSQTVYYYVDSYCSGTSFSRSAGQMDGDFTNDTPGTNGYFDNKLDSGAFTGYITSC